MVRCPRDKRSFDKLDSEDKAKVKEDLLIENTDQMSKSLNPGKVLVKLFSKKLIDSDKSEELRKLQDRRSDNSVITEALEQVPKHHHREKPPWWDRFDAVLRETDYMDFFYDMNPWLDRSDHGAADGPTPDEISPRQSNRGKPTPYSPDTPLFDTKGMADFLEELCQQGAIWRELARHLGLTLEDQLYLKNYQEDLHIHLVDAYAERYEQHATVGGLTRALTQLGDEGRDIVRQMEGIGVIQPMACDGSEATGVMMKKNDSDGASACYPCGAESRFRDPSSSEGSGYLDLPSRSHHVPRNPRSSGSRRDHRRSVADPLSDTVGNHTDNLTLTSATAVEATRSDSVYSPLQQYSSSTRSPKRTSTGLAQQPHSLKDNAEQESDRNPSTDFTDRVQTTLNGPQTCSQEVDQATPSVNQALKLFDLQTDCGDALAFNEKSAQNTDGCGVATRSTDTLPTENEEPSASTYPKEYWCKTPQETALQNENAEEEDAPNQYDHKLGPGTQNNFYISRPGNVYIGTSMAVTNEPAEESHTPRTNHLRNHQEDPLHSSGSATTDDRLVSPSSTQPEPWNLEAHETQPKYVTGVQESDNDEAATEEHSNLMTSTKSLRDHQNEEDVQKMSLAQEPTLQKYPPDDVHHDEVDDCEPNVGLGAQTHHPVPKEREWFLRSLRSFTMEFVDGWLSLE